MSIRITAHPKIFFLLCIGVIAIGGQSVISAVAAANSSTEAHVAQRWSIPGPGGSNFLLVSEKDHRLYVSRDTQLTIIDTNDGKTIGEIRDLTDVRGIALDTDGKVGYIGDGISGKLQVFSVPMVKVTASVNIGGTPDAIVFEPVTRHIFVFDSHNKLAVILDPKSLQVIGTVKLPGRPGAALADGNGSVFTNLVSTSQLARIDARTLNAPSLFQLSPCVGPSGMAMDIAHSLIFSACENRLVAVSDGQTGKLVASVPVGEGAKTVGYDADNSLIFSANGEGTLTVIKEESATRFSPIGTVKTEPGARTMAFNPERDELYLFSARFGQRPGPTSEELEFRPTPVPGSSVVLVLKP